MMHHDALSQLKRNRFNLICVQQFDYLKHTPKRDRMRSSTNLILETAENTMGF